MPPMQRADGLAAPTRALVPLALVGIALVALTAAGPLIHHRLGGIAHWVVVVLTAAGASWAAMRHEHLDSRRALALIIVVAIAMRLALLFADTYLSSDAYRYVWDGRVQAAGINPYRYVPAAPALEFLRDATIYPRINRADYAPTIYPPAAQMFFLAITRLGESILVMKLALLAFEALAIAATATVLVRLALPPTRLAAFAWHPLAVWEIAGNAHIDAMMIGLMLAALVAMLAGRTILAAVAATLAVLVKPLAVVILPVLWRPWSLVVPAVVGGLAVLLYVPYLSVGWGVLGFLPDYFGEEELVEGQGFRWLLILERIIGPVAHGALIYLAIAAVALGAIATRIAFRADRSAAASARALAILATAVLFVLTPHYAWYYLMLVPFLAVFPGWWSLWVLTVGGMQMYHAIPNDPLPDYHLRQIVFHLAALAAAARDIVAARVHAVTISRGARPT